MKEAGGLGWEGKGPRDEVKGQIGRRETTVRFHPELASGTSDPDRWARPEMGSCPLTVSGREATASSSGKCSLVWT